jgi:iron-sulfur cluster assembly accessory protein
MSNDTQQISEGISLTPRAAEEVQNIIRQQGMPAENTRLRVAIRGGGCSGFSYVLDLTEEAVGESDELLSSHGVGIVVDNKSLLYMQGVEIDFKDEMIQKGFVFKNPNASSTCGCGHSFSA